MHVAVAFVEKRVADYLFCIALIAARQPLERFRDSLGSLEKAFAIGILPDQLELLADQLLELISHLCIRHSCSPFHAEPVVRASRASLQAPESSRTRQ